MIYIYDLLVTVLDTLITKYYINICLYTAGKHELWIKPNYDKDRFSSEKFTRILRLCESLGVQTSPRKLHIRGDVADDVTVTSHEIWVVPLFTWYTKPEDSLDDTLYSKPESGEDNKEFDETVWPDNHLCNWCNLAEDRLKFIAAHNEQQLRMCYDAPVVTFSHFLPRADLIQSSLLKERRSLMKGVGLVSSQRIYLAQIIRLDV